jgi:BON domain
MKKIKQRTKWIGAVVMVVIVTLTVILWVRDRRHDNSQEAWRAVLKKCADTNLLGADVVYFGASNKVGPGSVWRKANDGSYRLFYELSDLEHDAERRKNLVIMNNSVGCQGMAATKWSIGVGLPFESEATPLKAEVSADLKRARDVNVAIDGYAMDELKEGLFEEVIRSNPRLSQNPSSFVIAANAIRVTGFSADFNFSEDDAAELRPKYKNNVVSLKEGATLKSDWISKTTLKMTATEPFYMLAGFSNVSLNKNGGGISVAQDRPVKANEVVALGNERFYNEDIQAEFEAILAAQEIHTVHAKWSETDRVLVLKGSVPTFEVREQVERLAKNVPEVNHVVNHVEIAGSN